jgi:tetratricopeptide (TPR) repeat protein
VRIIVWFLILSSISTWAHSSKKSEFEQQLKRAKDYFSEGKYRATKQALDALDETLKESGGNKNLIGLISYWSGITANRLQDYPQAIKAFEQALAVDYRPIDIYYEYGQALFAADKLIAARSAFRESVKRGYKKGVSLYYIGFITQSLKDYKKAITFYRAIHKLPLEEQEDTLQAAELQIADIFLEQAERHPDVFKAVDKYVIPQYRKAQAINPETRLAKDIEKKILDLQQKYELILFRMRNGRPTNIPPYFLKLSQDITYDDNPVFAALETTNSSAKQGSLVSKTEAFGRYSFYIKDIISISPELRMNYSRHMNREPEIFRNDNYVIIPSLRTSYEHMLANKPASFLVDYDYVYTQRDINARESLEFNSRVQTYSIGERIVGLFGNSETTFRARFRTFDSFSEQADSKTTGLVMEHVKISNSGKVIIYTLSYDQTKVMNKEFDTNTLFLRADVIFKQWNFLSITPQLGFGLTLIDPINNQKRGLETTINPSLRLSKPMGKRYRMSFHADYMQNDSKDKQNFAYQKTFYGLELEYLF